MSIFGRLDSSHFLCRMFLKAADKKDETTGKVYRYYKLCQSYRIGEKTRHRTIFTLGKLTELQTEQERKALADRIEQLLSGSMEMFPDTMSEQINNLANGFCQQIQRKGFASQGVVHGNSADFAQPDIQQVDLSSAEMEDVREVGTEWLCKQAIDELGLSEFLTQLGWSKTQVENALIHIISKASYPCSEHKTAMWINDNSSVAELFGRHPESINRFDLYRASLMLFGEKDNLETHLSKKTNELFDLEDKIILYDLTNTYFEGRKVRSKLAKFGRSKEKRNDAKIIAIALVVNIQGFVKYSRIYRGNIADCKTLEHTVNDLSGRTSFTQRKPTVVIDAGIATDANLAMLRAAGYHYVVVSRTKLKDIEIPESGQISLKDKRNNPIEVSWVKTSDGTDQYLRVHSQMKAVKEGSMNNHFSDRFEEELDTVARAIHKKGGTKKYGKVMERIGRIKERYPSANKHYEIEVKQSNGIVNQIHWKHRYYARTTGEGVYFIRTDLAEQNEALVWNIYNTIRQIESVFRVFKSDLELRPVFHKNDDHTMAHLFLAIVAYSVVNTIRYKLKKQEINDSWGSITRTMNTQKTGTLSLRKKDGQKVFIRLCSKPNLQVQKIYQALGYKMKPFHRKKFVFPEI
jgi:transposase